MTWILFYTILRYKEPKKEKSATHYVSRLNIPLEMAQTTVQIEPNFGRPKRRNCYTERNDRYVQGNGHVERNGHERPRWPSLHANQCGQEHNHSLPSLRQRDAHRG